MPSVSVLLPIHNGERYLCEAIDSILSQTILDLELIAIDDGSTDRTQAILVKYAALDSRVRVITRERRGLVVTLNEGISLARGEWIMRMDADDVATSDRLAVQLEHLRLTNADFCGGSIECFGDWVAVWTYPIGQKACEVFMLFDTPFAHPAVTGRRSAFAALRYDPDKTHAEDYDIWQRAWAGGYRLTNVSSKVLRYRVHAKQVSLRHQDRQSKAADLIRSRHWKAVLPDIDNSKIELILAGIRHGQLTTALLMPILRQLMSRYDDEAQQVLLFNCFKVFCRLAGNDLFAAKNWLALVAESNVRSYRRNLGRTVALTALSLLRIRTGGAPFRYLQRLRATYNSWWFL